MFKYLMIAGSLLIASHVLTACSGGANAGDDLQAQQARDSKVLEDLYSGVEGTWTGRVTNPASGLRDFEAELKVYVYYVQDGTNIDGTPKLRPTLNARFQPKDFLTETDMLNLVGTYDRLGRFVMTADPKAAGGAAFSPPGQTLSIRGSVGQGNMSVELARTGGVWGNFTATRSSTASSAPRSGELTEYRERFYRLYAPLEGRYRGRLHSANGNDYEIEFALVVVEQPTTAGYSMPVLSALYSRLDAGPPGSLSWTLKVDYNGQTGGITMGTASASTMPGMPGGGGTSLPGVTMSVTGYLVDVGGVKRLDVRVRNGAVYIGDVSATRIGKSGRDSKLPSGLYTAI